MAKYCIERQGPALYADCAECRERTCMRFICLVSGAPGFSDYGFFKERLETLTGNFPHAAVASCGGGGIEALAERYAREKNFPYIGAPWQSAEEAYACTSKTLAKGAVYFAESPMDGDARLHAVLAGRHGIQFRAARRPAAARQEEKSGT